MEPEPPRQTAADRLAERRRQKQTGRRHVALAAAYIVLVAIVLGVAFGCPGGKETASSTTTTDSGAASTTSTTGAPALSTYTAELTGDAEIHPVSTSATGTLTLTVAFDGSSVDYVLKVSDITDVSVARLHEGKAGASGETIFTLYDNPRSGAFSGTLAQGSFTAADLVGPLKGKTIEDLVTMILADSIYLNVGTSTNKEGEIRGQLK
jgi:hypothetical protein